MQEGTLHKTEAGWVVKYDQVVYTPVGNNDYKVTRQEATIPTHKQHTMWLKMFGEEGRPVCFRVDTVAEGTSEYDIMDVDVAILTACEPITYNYVQD